MPQLTVLYGTIVFNDEPTAIIKEIDGVEHIEADSLEDCQEIAEHNARFYGGDYIIPSIYDGEITMDIKDTFVTKKKPCFLGKNPLEAFPSIFSGDQK